MKRNEAKVLPKFNSTEEFVEFFEDNDMGGYWESIPEAHFEFAPQGMTRTHIHKSEDGYWIAECPSLRGCVTQGRTLAEAIANSREAIKGYLAALEEDGLSLSQGESE